MKNPTDMKTGRTKLHEELVPNCFQQPAVSAYRLFDLDHSQARPNVRVGRPYDGDTNVGFECGDMRHGKLTARNKYPFGAGRSEKSLFDMLINAVEREVLDFVDLTT